jgi:hypothetical protein
LTEYADPDLETIAPLPPLEISRLPEPVEEPPRRDRSRWTVVVVSMVVAALLAGFGITTVILNVTDSGKHSASVSPGDVLGGLIVNQRDVPAKYTVHLPADGINVVAPTLDLCNGIFPSEAKRTARRQVYVGPSTAPTTSFSTEAVLYHAPADAAQAMDELRSVAAQCPPTPVVSPVGEPTAITKFREAPDKSWPKNSGVQRQAYSFVTTDPQTRESVPGIAVYLRRGRALMGVYFAKPNGAQVPIDGKTAIPDIVALFETRMAGLPESVVNG